MCLCMYVHKLAKVLRVSVLLCPLEVFSDGNGDCCYVLSLCFQLEFIDCGQFIKIKQNGGVVGKKKLVVYGELSLGGYWGCGGILIVFCVSALVVWWCVFKVKWCLVCGVGLFRFYWDFVNEFKCGFSPAKLEGLTDHLWI